MTTAATRSAAVQEFVMQERKSPILFRWEKPGDTISGILVKLETVEFEPGRKTPKATVLDVESGQPYEFIMPYDLARKIHTSDRGRMVIATFERENPDVAKNGNAMKEFSVKVSDRKVAVDSLQITDDDIPF